MELYIAGSLDSIVFVCSARRDADALHGLGCDTVFSESGWPKSHINQLKGKTVCIFQGSDDRSFAQRTATALYGTAASLQILDVSRYGAPAGMISSLGEDRTCEETIELSRKANGYGGDQTFFLCPACGERRRYLYLTGATFLCRKCSKLNYRSQQATRSDSMYFYRKGCALVEKHLDTWPRVRPDGFSFCAWIPERPRYMHQSTYRKYLRRFAKYQHHHQIRQMEDIGRILRIFR